MKLKELQNFLNQNEIPTVKQAVGFLEMIRKQHNETINSNLYSYFLSCDEGVIKNNFLSALLELINDKANKDLKFVNHYALTEVITNKGRVDIVVKDLLTPSIIIIENKLFHWLHNDLSEYWSFFKIDDSKKVGILLTLEPYPIHENVQGKFINITHWEWIKKVKEQLNFDNIKNGAYKVYLTDFFNTIERLSTTYQMNESAKFFFQHASQVNKANHTLIEGHKFLEEQYRLIASELGLETYGNEITWKNFWDEDNVLDTYLTITTHDILLGNGYKYKIIIELKRKDVDRKYELVNKFENHEQFDIDKIGQTIHDYCHFLVREYNIDINQLHTFSDHVVENIKKDFAKIFIEIVQYLYPNKNIDRWKVNFQQL